MGSELDLPQVVCEYEDGFGMSYRDYLHREMWTFVLSYTLARCDAPNPGGPLTTRQPAETLVNVG